MRMRAIVALAKKDLRLLARDRTALFFTLLFPVIFSMFFGTIFSGAGGGAGGPKGLAVRVVDLDQSEASEALLKRIEGGDELTVTRVATKDDAAKAVLARDAAGYILLPKGYGESQSNMLAMFGGGGGGPAIEVGVDPSRVAERGMLEGVMQKYAFMGMFDTFRDPKKMRGQIGALRATLGLAGGMDPAYRGELSTFLNSTDAFMAAQEARGAGANGAVKDGAADPGGNAGFSPVRMKFEEVRPPRAGPTNAYAVSFPQGVIWGIMGATIGFAMSIVVERQHGTLARLRMTPMPFAQVLMGKALACFGTVCGVCVLMFALAAVAFGVRFTSPLLLVLAVASVGVAFVGLMMLASCGGRTEASASGVAWATMMVFALVGGAAVPLFAMPGWVQRLSDFSPVKWSILAMEGAIWRGLDLGQMMVPCGILLAIGVGTFSVGAWVFSRQSVG